MKIEQRIAAEKYIRQFLADNGQTDVLDIEGAMDIMIQLARAEVPSDGNGQQVPKHLRNVPCPYCFAKFDSVEALREHKCPADEDKQEHEPWDSVIGPDEECTTCGGMRYPVKCPECGFDYPAVEKGQ